MRVHPEILDREKLPAAAKGGKDVWRRRYRQINDWERYLSDNGIRIVKLFLNLSKEEQRIRFLRRLDLPDHNWKFSTADVKERERWDDYKTPSPRCSRTPAPNGRRGTSSLPTGSGSRGSAPAPFWSDALMEIDPRFPKVSKQQREALLEIKRSLEAEAPEGAHADPFEHERGRRGSLRRTAGTGKRPPERRVANRWPRARSRGYVRWRATRCRGSAAT